MGRRGAAIVAIVVALIAVVFVATRSQTFRGTSHAQVNAEEALAEASVRRVLSEDDEVSRRFLRSRPSNIATYATEMAKIQLDGCPPDFAEAFYRHSRAWAAHVAAARGQSSDAVAEAALALLSGGSSLAVLGAGFHGAKQGADGIKATTGGIESTWTEVVACAIRHKVYWGVGDATTQVGHAAQVNGVSSQMKPEVAYHDRVPPPRGANMDCALCDKPADRRFSCASGRGSGVYYFCSDACKNEWEDDHR